MTAVSAIPFASIDAPRVELARLCRQICLGLEAEPSAATRSLDHDLSDALATVRAVHGPDSIHENDLLDLFRAERLRVSDASLLAELLAPKLAAFLRTTGLSASPFAETAPRTASMPAPAASRPPLSASSPLPAAPTGPLGIADLLDGMLEQDRENERTRRTGPRR
ncbi:MAG: hypothetical protein QM760_04375 [Nibricoccus sp.]